MKGSSFFLRLATSTSLFSYAHGWAAALLKRAGEHVLSEWLLSVCVTCSLSAAILWIAFFIMRFDVEKKG